MWCVIAALNLGFDIRQSKVRERKKERDSERDRGRKNIDSEWYGIGMTHPAAL